MICRFHPTLVVFAALLLLHFGASAQNRSVGIGLAYNEFSAVLQLPADERQQIRVSANLDMTGVISGDVLYPGFSADFVYLFEFFSIDSRPGEKIVFIAGPGVNAGYVRNHSGEYGLMASMMGCIGFEYHFNVPFSISLTLEPDLGMHINRTRFGETRMDFYKAGLVSSLYPHVGIKYLF